jgi:hypothetical protein
VRWREVKGSLGVVTLHHVVSRPVFLAAPDVERDVIVGLHADAELLQRIQGHIHIGAGFQPGCHHDLRIAVQQGKGEKQPGDEL